MLNLKEFKLVSYITLGIFLAMMMTGCDNSSSELSSIADNSETGSVAFTVIYDDPAPQGVYVKTIRETSTFMRIVKAIFSPLYAIAGFTDDCDCEHPLEGVIYDKTGKVVASGGPWACFAHEGVIRNVPIGSDYKLVLMVKDSHTHHTVYRSEKSGVTVQRGIRTTVSIAEPKLFKPELINMGCNSDSRATLPLQWKTVQGAAKYRLMITPLNTYRPRIDKILNSATLSYTPENLDAGKPFACQIVALDDYGNEGISDVWTFITPTSGIKAVMSDGQQIYYEIAGQGSPLIFIHGREQTNSNVFTASQSWNPQFSEFAKTYQVIRYDIRGYGNSLPLTGQDPYNNLIWGEKEHRAVTDLLELMKQLGIAKADICGLSLGSAIAAQLAVFHPDRVNRLILASPWLNHTFHCSMSQFEILNQRRVKTLVIAGYNDSNALNEIDYAKRLGYAPKTETILDSGQFVNSEKPEQFNTLTKEFLSQTSTAERLTGLWEVRFKCDNSDVYQTLGLEIVGSSADNTFIGYEQSGMGYGAYGYGAACGYSGYSGMEGYSEGETRIEGTFDERTCTLNGRLFATAQGTSNLSNKYCEIAVSFSTVLTASGTDYIPAQNLTHTNTSCLCNGKIRLIRKGALPTSSTTSTTVITTTSTTTTRPTSTTTTVPTASDFSNSFGMTFKRIPAGTYMMGSPSNELGRTSSETQHSVTITKAFYIQTTEVTQGQWKAIMKTNPASFSSCGDNCPVENVSWNDVQSFIASLNLKGEGIYRLPTEAEWEYAARGGTSTAFYNGAITQTDCSLDPNLNDIGWYCGNAGSTTHPVAQKRPNAFGLYDTSGNVWEWCQDWYGDLVSVSIMDPTGPSTGSYHVVRGGAWGYGSTYCRSASRHYSSPSSRGEGLGFRLVWSSL